MPTLRTRSSGAEAPAVSSQRSRTRWNRPLDHLESPLTGIIRSLSHSGSWYSDLHKYSPTQTRPLGNSGLPHQHVPSLHIKALSSNTPQRDQDSRVANRGEEVTPPF